MQEKQIPFNGITLTPYSDISPDGQLSDSQNMELYNGALRPITVNGQKYSGFDGYNLIHIHTTNYFTHYIFTKEGDSLLYYSLNLNNIPQQTDLNIDIKKIQSLGLYLIVIDKNYKINYILWDTDKYIFANVSDLNINLQFSLNKIDEEQSSIYKTYNYGELSLYGESYTNFTILKEDRRAELQQEILTLYNNIRNTTLSHSQIPPEIFFIRYAIKYKSGETTRLSPPVMMIPASSSPISVYYKNIASDAVKETLTIEFNAVVNRFNLIIFNHTPITQEIHDNFQDIIEGVDVFMTNPRTPTSFGISSGSSTDFNYKNWGIFKGLKELNGKNFYQIHDINRNYLLDTVDNDNNYIIDPHYFAPVHQLNIGVNWPSLNEYSENSVFYKIGSISLDDLMKSEILIPTDIANITTKDKLEDDAESINAEYAENIFTINGRLAKFALVKNLKNTISSYLHFPYTNGFTDILWDDIYNPNIYDKSIYNDILGYITIDIFLEKEDKRYVTRNVQKNVSIYPNKFLWYFFYPDKDAKKAVIKIQNDGLFTAFKKFAIIELVEHPFLNGSYWVSDLNNSITFTDGEPSDYTITPDEGLHQPLNNQIFFSEVFEPSKFPLETKNIVGTGTILALSSIVKPLSQGQYGQYPIMAFCSDGNYALQINEEGLIVAAPPMQRDVCINPNSITQIDGAVIYVAERGVMMADGNDIQCISSQLTGVTDKFTDEENGVTIRPMDLFRKCNPIFDYANQRLIFFDPTNELQYALTYSLSSGTWNNITVLDFIKAINIYPYSYIQDKNGNIILIDQSYDFQPTQQPIEGKIITRPLKLDTLQLKRLTAFALQGIFKEKQQISLYGSNDAVNWKHIGTTKRAAVNNITGRTYKYFRFIINTKLTPEENISGFRIQYDIRPEKRLR